MNQRLKADLALTFCCLIWGATFVVVKQALDHASVFVFMATRFVLAALLMALIYRATLRKLDRATVRAGAQIGFFMFSGYIFQTIGLKFTSPSKAAFITGFGIVFVPLLLAVFWGRRINAWVLGGAFAALVGLYYLSVPVTGFAALNLGDMLVLVCALLFAFHIIFVGHYTPHHSVAALSFLQVATSALLYVLALPLLAVTRWEPPHADWSGSLISAVLITSVGATALAFSAQVWAQRYTTPTHAAILFSLEPVFAALTSYLVLDERLGGRALFGAALILAGILLAELKGPAPAAPESSVPVADTSTSSE